MNRLQWKIGPRLAAAMFVLLALLMLLCGVPMTQMLKMRAQTLEITTNWLPSVSLVNQMNTDTADYRLAETGHVLATDDAAMAIKNQAMAAMLASLEKNRAAYVKLISSAEEQHLYDSFAADWKAYMAVHDKLHALQQERERRGTGPVGRRIAEALQQCIRHAQPTDRPQH